MADIKLKDRTGAEHTYIGKRQLRVPGTDGNLVIFTQGNGEKDEEEKTIELDFSGATTQEVTPTDGKVLSKVTVKKPETLISENIKKNVDIGGVTGTLEESTRPEYAIKVGDTVSDIYINTQADTTELNEWLKSNISDEVGEYAVFFTEIGGEISYYWIAGVLGDSDDPTIAILSVANGSAEDPLYLTKDYSNDSISWHAGWNQNHCNFTEGIVSDSLPEGDEMPVILLPEKLMDKYFAKEPVSIEFGGPIAGGNPKLNISYGEKDSNGWYPNASIKTTNLLSGMNSKLDGKNSDSSMDGNAFSVYPTVDVSPLKKDGAYVPHAKLMVSFSDETYNVMTDIFIMLGYKNAKTREWIRTALTQCQDIDFTPVTTNAGTANIDISMMYTIGTAFPNPILLYLLTGLASYLAPKAKDYTEYFKYAVQPMLYSLGACLDVRVHRSGYGEASEVSNVAKWYFNTVYVMASSKNLIFRSQNIVIGDNGLALIPNHSDTDDTANMTEQPTYWADTSKTLLVMEPGKHNTILEPEYLSNVFCYQLNGLNGTGQSTTIDGGELYVQKRIEVSIDDNTGGLLLDGHGNLYLVATDDGNPPVSDEKYSTPLLETIESTGEKAISFGKAKNDATKRYMIGFLNGVTAGTNQNGFDSTDRCSLIKYFPGQDEYEFEVKEVGMEFIQSDSLIIKTDKEGKIL